MCYRSDPAGNRSFPDKGIERFRSCSYEARFLLGRRRFAHELAPGVKRFEYFTLRVVLGIDLPFKAVDFLEVVRNRARTIAPLKNVGFAPGTPGFALLVRKAFGLETLQLLLHLQIEN